MILLRPNAACLKHDPKNGVTWILAAAVWFKLKKKYFNPGTAKEACEFFGVRAKQLSHVLTDKKVSWCKHCKRDWVQKIVERRGECKSGY